MEHITITVSDKTISTPRGFEVHRIYEPDPKKAARALQILLEYEPLGSVQTNNSKTGTDD